MRYIIYKAGAVLQMMQGLTALAAEFDSDGYAHREIGLNADGEVIHRKPSEEHRHGDFGLLDSPPIDVDIEISQGSAEELEAPQFEELWQRPNRATGLK